MFSSFEVYFGVLILLFLIDGRPLWSWFITIFELWLCLIQLGSKYIFPIYAVPIFFYIFKASRGFRLTAFLLPLGNSFCFPFHGGSSSIGGVLGKFLVLLAGGLSSGYFQVSLVVVIFSIVAAFYYVRLVQLIYFPIDFSVIL